MKRIRQSHFSFAAPIWRLRRIARIGVIGACSLMVAPTLWAQEVTTDHSGMNHDAMPGMDHGSTNDDTMSGMDHSGMNHDTMPNMNQNTANHAAMSGMDHSAMAPQDTVTNDRDPHAFADGFTLTSGPYALPGRRLLRLADEHSRAALRVDRLEATRVGNDNAAAYDLQAWYGRDYNRAVLRAEGGYDAGKLADSALDLVWGHAIAAFWDTHAGLRYDIVDDHGRGWLALGIQGLAPYWFEIDATAYVSDKGQTALHLSGEYDLLLTQRVILQPRVAAELYGKPDAERALGEGLAQLSAGLRLRYEIRREFAPYLGIEYASAFAGTADALRAAQRDVEELRAVVGLRLWY